MVGDHTGIPGAVSFALFWNDWMLVSVSWRFEDGLGTIFSTREVEEAEGGGRSRRSYILAEHPAASHNAPNYSSRLFDPASTRPRAIDTLQFRSKSSPESASFRFISDVGLGADSVKPPDDLHLF